MSDRSQEEQPSLSDIVRLIGGVKEDLTKSISEQASSFENSLKQSIDKVVAPIIQRQEEYEVKSDQRMKQIEEKSDMSLKQLEDQVVSLTVIVKEGNASKQPAPLLYSQTLFQPTDLQPGPRSSDSQETISPGSSETSDASEAIKALVRESKLVVGIGPMHQSDFEQFGEVSNEEAIKLAAIEALRLELNIKEEEISEDDIANTFLPNKPPKVPRVYIRFHKQEHADLCFKLAKGLKNSNAKVFRYFPRQFQARVRALEDVAFLLRKTSVPAHKTEVVYTDNDVQLIICPRGQFRYQPYLAQGLPPIDMAPIRSPPQGRSRHKRNRSDSSSPSNVRKTSRHESPPKPSAIDGVVRNIDESTKAADEDTGSDGVRPGTAPSAPPMPLFLQDLGGYSNIQVVSPLTGKVSFDFKEPVNLRRQSLNI